MDWALICFGQEGLQNGLTAERWWVLVRTLHGGAGVQQMGDSGAKMAGGTWLSRQDECPAMVWKATLRGGGCLRTGWGSRTLCLQA